MTQLKAFKYKTKCDKKSIYAIKEALYICRNLYNSALREKRESYPILKKQKKKQITYYDQKKNIPYIREYWSEMQKYPSVIYAETIKRVDNSYNNFYRLLAEKIAREKKENEERKKNGLPPIPIKYKKDQFKPKDKSMSEFKTLVFGYNAGWFLNNKGSFYANKHPYDFVINNNILKITGMGRFKLLSYKKYPIIGKVKQLTLTLDKDENVWVSILTECLKPESYPKTYKKVGIDLGLTYLISDTDRNQFENLRLGKKYSELKNKLQSKKDMLKNEGKFGKTYDKIKKVLSKINKKIRNKKIHYYHELANYYVKNYDLIAMEKLNIKNMVKSASGTVENPGKKVAQKKGLNKSIHDASWYTLRLIFQNKCKQYNRTFVAVDPRFTSQKCFSCGELVIKSLSVRTHTCNECGYIEDRDINAADNILKKGLTQLREEILEKRKLERENKKKLEEESKEKLESQSTEVIVEKELVTV